MVEQSRSLKYTLAEVERLRDLRYRRTPELRVHTEEQALKFVNEVGFCFLFGAKGVEMPTLWAAICGAQRRMPRNHSDADLGRTWRWKDSLPTRRAIYYGKLLRAKPTLLSLDLLPHFYALSPNYGHVEDYLLQYQEGKLSVEAKNVCEVLLREGAMSTGRLRRLAGLRGGGDNARRFDRAITELQVELKIVKVGISDANRWGYSYVYDLFVRRFPHVAEAARQIDPDEAMATLLVRYLHNVIVQPERLVQRIFRWDDWEWGRLLMELAERGVIRQGVLVEGLREPCLACVPGAEARG